MAAEDKDLHALREELQERVGRAKTAETKLEELAAKLEVEHPAVAEALREVIDTLGKAGI
jgi:hypothetical protein